MNTKIFFVNPEGLEFKPALGSALRPRVFPAWASWLPWSPRWPVCHPSWTVAPKGRIAGLWGGRSGIYRIS